MIRGTVIFVIVPTTPPTVMIGWAPVIVVATPQAVMIGWAVISIVVVTAAPPAVMIRCSFSLI